MEGVVTRHSLADTTPQHWLQGVSPDISILGKIQGWGRWGCGSLVVLDSWSLLGPWASFSVVQNERNCKSLWVRASVPSGALTMDRPQARPKTWPSQLAWEWLGICQETVARVKEVQPGTQWPLIYIVCALFWPQVSESWRVNQSDWLSTCTGLQQENKQHDTIRISGQGINWRKKSFVAE